MSKTESSAKTVLIWDLDETLIIYKSLLDRSFAVRYNKNTKVCENIGLEIERFIFEIADRRLLFRDLEDENIVNILDVQFSPRQVRDRNRNGRKLPDRYATVTAAYDQFSATPKSLFRTRDGKAYLKLLSRLKIVTESWTQIAMKALTAVDKNPLFVNVLVTTTHMIPAIAKLLFYGLGEIFALENIYSAAEISKVKCFERIKNRFGSNCFYVAVGDGKEEQLAASEMKIAFWKIVDHVDLIKIYRDIISGEIKKFAVEDVKSEANAEQT